MLTVKEASNKLFVCQEAVRQYIRTGKLKAIEIYRGLRKEYRIKQSDLEDFRNKYQK